MLVKVFTPWHFSYFVALQRGIKIYFFEGDVSFDLHNRPTTLKIENMFYWETNKKQDKKTKLECA